VEQAKRSSTFYHHSLDLSRVEQRGIAAYNTKGASYALELRMATVTLPETPQELSVPPDSLFRLSVQQYHQLAEAGVLAEDDRVELIEGILVKKMTVYPFHAFVVQVLVRTFEALSIPGWCYRAQQPITLSTSEPEPDGALVRGRHEDYRQQHPAPPGIGLVVEVADSSLPQDRGVKKRMYARAGIPVYWIANLVDRTFEVYSSPDKGDYRQTKILRAADALPIELDGKAVGEISVKSLFGE
jgi:Uma2 family endonuclease